MELDYPHFSYERKGNKQMRSSMAKWLGALIIVALMSLTGTAFAAPPQSDDFSKGLSSFWKVKQVTEPSNATFPTPSYTVTNGKLNLTSANNDVYQGTWEPYYVYQDGITGDFTCQLKVWSTPELNLWSNTGLMIVQSPVPDTITMNSDIPSWFLIGASRDNGTEYKGGGQGMGGSTTVNHNLQPPYWLRMDRQGSILTEYNSFDGGKTWNQVTQLDLSDSSANSGAAPITDPVAVGIFQQTHDGTVLGTSVVSNFEAGPFTMAGKLPGDAAAPATVTGSVVDSKGNPLPATTLIVATDASGNVVDAEVDANGMYTTYLAPGTYTLGGDPASYDNSAQKPVTLTAGQNLTLNLTLTPLPGVDLSTSSADTTVTAKETSDPANAAAVDPSDLGPINPTFDDSKWNTVNMPEDLATTDMLVANNSWFWYRVSFKLPASFQSSKGHQLALNGFNVDDGDFTFVNGHYVGATINNWNAIRNYPVPSDYINWTGTNVVSILGQQGGGGAGNGTAADIMKLSVGPSSPASVFGRVITKTGAAVGGATLTLTDSKGAKLTATSNNVDGGYSFTGLTPGSYTLTASGVLSTIPAPATVTTTAGNSTLVPDITVTGTGFGPADLAAVDVSKLVNNDIGAGGDKGTLKVTGSQVELTAGGADIWNAVDDFSFASSPTPVTGDFTAVVDATPAAGITDWTKAGIMARVDMTPGSQNVTAINSFYYGPFLQWRAATGGASANAGSNDLPNKTIMLTRSGDTFSVYRANSDGSNANLIGQQTLAGFPKTLVIGLDATSHTVGTLGTATFANFKLSSTAFNPSGGGTTVVLGDVNGDGKITISDATTVLQFAVKLGSPTAAQTTAADVNKDGKIDIKDVTLILKAIVNGTGF